MKISISNRQKIAKVDLRRLRRTLARLLKWLHIETSEISLSLVDDAEIRALNRQYFNKTGATNVISFSMIEGDYGYIHPLTLGDIVLSVETASRHAVIENISLMDEIEFLLIHGLLHLIGYNHEYVNTEEAERMYSRQRELFLRLRNYSLG